ncbi:MAG: hypothetical protein ACP5NX_04480 [Candidatus Bilamarchaeaceae archaeon]
MISDMMFSIVSAVGGLLVFFGVIGYASGSAGGGMMALLGTVVTACAEGARLLVFRGMSAERRRKELENFNDNIAGRFAYPVLALLFYILLGSTVLLAFGAALAIDAVLKAAGLATKRMDAER